MNRSLFESSPGGLESSAGAYPSVYQPMMVSGGKRLKLESLDNVSTRKGYRYQTTEKKKASRNQTSATMAESIKAREQRMSAIESERAARKFKKRSLRNILFKGGDKDMAIIENSLFSNT